MTTGFDPAPLINNPRWKTLITIRRYSRTMDHGRAVDVPVDVPNVVACVFPNGGLGMTRTPEVERQSSTIMVFTQFEIRTGVGLPGPNPVGEAPADDIIYHGQLYQVVDSDDYSQWDFYVVTASLAEAGGRAVA